MKLAKISTNVLVASALGICPLSKEVNATSRVFDTQATCTATNCASTSFNGQHSVNQFNDKTLFAQSKRSNYLAYRSELYKGQYLLSSNGRFKFVLQFDGNLVLYDNSTRSALWASWTNGRAVNKCVMQSDGNFVIYGYPAAIWASNTGGNPGAYLIVQNDGNVVIYRNGRPIWATNTGRS